MKKSTVEGHRRVLRIAENLIARGVGESSLGRFLVAVFQVKKLGVDKLGDHCLTLI